MVTRRVCDLGRSFEAGGLTRGLGEQKADHGVVDALQQQNAAGSFIDHLVNDHTGPTRRAPGTVTGVASTRPYRCGRTRHDTPLDHAVVTPYRAQRDLA